VNFPRPTEWKKGGSHILQVVRHGSAWSLMRVYSTVEPFVAAGGRKNLKRAGVVGENVLKKIRNVVSEA